MENERQELVIDGQTYILEPKFKYPLYFKLIDDDLVDQSHE